jgi:hypothetical protein
MSFRALLRRASAGQSTATSHAGVPTAIASDVVAARVAAKVFVYRDLPAYRTMLDEGRSRTSRCRLAVIPLR